ncbi:unnamed protein product [Adineta steineri]|uniref:Uncharacterized protein n=1 Tax=Adineta steineri TaxID=433720 RepID=A0A814JIJ4_9BILA|nr:unnamed protein product [Adineta steineri]CAF4266312.1 unnamed protein product [Adineta steineri]
MAMAELKNKTFSKYLFLLICLLGGMICALIASSGWAQQADWISQLCQGYAPNENVTTSINCSQNSTINSYKLLSANTVKIAAISSCVLCLVIILIIYLIHVFTGLRKRRKWKMIARIIAILFIVLCLLIFAISIAAVFWELKLITIFGIQYTSNAYQLTPNGYCKAQTGLAGATAGFGVLSGSFLLIDIICRLLAIGSLRKQDRRRKKRISVIS